MAGDDDGPTTKDLFRHGGFTLTASAVVLAAGLVLGFMYVFGWGFLARTSAPWRGAAEMRERVEGGSHRIAAYENFHDLCAQVRSNEASIRNLRRELASEPAPGEQRAIQINASITALENRRAESIHQYNADAAKTATAGKFRSSGLPYRLDPNDKETRCTSSSPSPEHT